MVEKFQNHTLINYMIRHITLYYVIIILQIFFILFYKTIIVLQDTLLLRYFKVLKKVRNGKGSSIVRVIKALKIMRVNNFETNFFSFDFLGHKSRRKKTRSVTYGTALELG